MSTESAQMNMFVAGVVMLGFYGVNRLFGLRRIAVTRGGEGMLPLLTRLDNAIAICGIIVIAIGLLLPFL